VLVNITGGADLTLGEVHQINEIIHDAVGDDAEIIFGAVHEPAMQGEIRVTVIATGFDRAVQPGVVTSPEPAVTARPAGASGNGSPVVIPFQQQRAPRTPSASPRVGSSDIPRRTTGSQPTQSRNDGQDLNDMEIPTFIRRQMD
jgi:cell division protein FtsZ